MEEKPSIRGLLRLTILLTMLTLNLNIKSESYKQLQLDPLPIFKLDWVTVYHSDNINNKDLVNKKKHIHALFKKGYATNLMNSK